MKSSSQPAIHEPKRVARLARRPGRGTATVELAICLPIIVLVVFGAVEGAGMMFLKQSLVQSAYEGAKVAIKPDSTSPEIEAATRSVLVSRSLNSADVTISPRNMRTAKRGDLITITVSAPSGANSLFSFGFFEGRFVSASAVMVKE